MSDDESVESECDYEAPSYLTENRKGVNASAISEIWRNQRGICRISDIPMSTSKSDSLYSAVLCPRIISQKMDETNCIIVCKCIADMQKSVQLQWRVFHNLLQTVSRSDF